MIWLYQITPIRNPLITGLQVNPEQAPAIFGKFFTAIIGVMLILATLWAFFQLLQAGLQWISSGGDKTGLENAQHRISNALLGLFLLFASWALYILILQFLGIISGPEFKFTLPRLF